MEKIQELAGLLNESLGMEIAASAQYGARDLVTIHAAVKYAVIKIMMEEQEHQAELERLM